MIWMGSINVLPSDDPSTSLIAVGVQIRVVQMEDLEAAMERAFAKISDPSSTDSIAIALRPLLRDAFKAGTKFGMDYGYEVFDFVRNAIKEGKALPYVAYAKELGGSVAPASAVVIKKKRKPAVTRAAKGRIAEILKIVLSESPGSTTSEAERLGLMLDSQIAIKSIGNELRRGRGTTYRKDGTGWFLISDEGNGTAGNASQAPAAPISLTHGGANATTIAA